MLDATVSELETGWYVVNDDLEFEGNGISVSGDVKLVIEDGKTMTVTVTRNPSQHAGINVPEGSSLAIYSQAGGTGTLVVSGGNTGGAAIGGNNNEKCGAVSVYGGRVAATGGDWGAGIGGGGHADGGAIAIYGGDVNAMGGVSAAGIGGGYEGNGGTVGIYGGVVRASSDSLNCGGIGKGLSGGAYSEIGEVELTVGENVYVQVRRPAGYADWFYVNRETGAVQISYVNRETGAVQISSVMPIYLVFDATTTAFPIVYMDGETELTGLLPTVYYYDVGVEDGLPVPEAPEGYAFAGWFDNPDLEGDPIDAISEREAGEITLWAKWHKLETVTYIDQYGVGHNKECRVFDSGTTQLWDGEWYVVKEDVTIEGGIAVLGDASLILVDGTMLRADSSVHNYKAGISVPQGTTLTVYAQSKGDDAGRLYAVGGFSAAGIGGDEYISCGTVIINGGQVLSQGGDSGAGIGGGIQGTGGDVIINGGIVDAIGYDVWCVGIGGGLSTSDNDTVMCMPHGTLTVAADRAVRVNSREMMPYVLARDPVTGEVSLENQDVILQNFRIDEAQEFAIIYMDGDTEMTGLEPASYVEGTGVTLPIATTVKKPGFTFDGWYESPDSDPDAGDEVVLSLPGTGTDLELCERTFYARWLEGETDDLVKKDGVGSLVATETGVFTEWALAGDVTGGRAPISFSAKDGTRLPPGLTVSGTTLSGTIARAGTYNFTLTVSDSLHAPQKIDIDYTIVVTGDPAVPVFEWDENGVLTNVNLKGNTDVTIPEGVKEIGTFQFAQLDYIEHLTLPNSLERIDDYAFYGCVNLLRVTFGSGLKYIGDFAFYGCEALSCDDPAGLYFPDSVEHIGEDAFKKTGLMRVSVPGGLYTPGGYIHPAFYYENTDVVYRTDETVFYILPGGGLWSVDSKSNTDIVIPNTVEIILSGAFEFNETIEKVTIPNTVTNIYVKGFQGCSKLASVIIPDSVRRIGAAAFDSCSSLKSVVVPDSVTELGESVFWGCSSLESVTLGTGVVEIDDFAFAECTSLQSIDIRGNLERIGIFAFWRCSSLSGELRLPGSITQICSWSFQECTSLNSLVVPDTSVVIYPWAFEGCHGLYSVNIGGEEVLAGRRMLFAASARSRAIFAASEKSITIGTRAFHGCTGLETAIIGKNVESIEGGAFSNCPKLDSVTVEEGNDNYMVGENGILLTKDGQTLVSAFGKETAIAVQATVKIIADGAFADYETLQSVVLPSGVTTISEAAFSNATAFATITIPQSVKTIGANAFFDTILATVHVAEGDTSRVRTLIAGSGYETTGVRFIEDLPAQVAPSIPGDDAAEVTGDAESGYVVTPSTTTGTVEVEIPSGLDPAKVTVEVPPTASVKPNGANVAVVKTVDATSYDITEFLDIPAADANGVINLGDATVKDEIIEEVLDPEEGAVLVLTPENPSIATAETRPGLTYTFYEGTTLQNMTQKAVKVGDGNAWMPTITVKGGTSGFYSVSVTK